MSLFDKRFAHFNFDGTKIKVFSYLEEELKQAIKELKEKHCNCDIIKQRCGHCEELIEIFGDDLT